MLNFMDDDEGFQLFSHSKDFSQGMGKIRPGQATATVALDGSGDFGTIQEAINALTSDGGVIYVKEGTYILTSQITIDKSNISLVGAGRATKLQMSVDDQMIWLNAGLSGITIQNMFLYGAGAGNTANDGIVTAPAGAGCTKCTISGCWIENCGDVGIYLSNTSDEGFIVTNNHVISGQADGITITGENHLVVGNEVRLNAGHAIFADLCNNSIISNNVASGSTGAVKSGVMIQNNSDQLVINANQCQDNTGYGIYIDNDCGRAIVTDNICLSNTTAQITTTAADTDISHNITV